MIKPIFTSPTLLQGKRYTPSEDTDVQKAWRAAGWKPSKPKRGQTRDVRMTPRFAGAF